jgi:uncharacterized protein YggE
MKRFFFLSLVVFPISAFAGGGVPDRPYICVDGYAEVQRPADMLTMKFNLVGSGEDLPKANEDAQSKATKVFAMLKSHKVADSDVVAKSIRTEPQFESDEKFGQRRDRLIGYKILRDFEIKLRDIAVYPKLIDELIALGGAEFTEPTEGDLSKRKEIEKQIVERALTNARENAEKTAKAMGVKIESIFAVSPIEFTKIEETMIGAGTERVTVTGRNIPAPAPAPEYRLEPITVSQTVHAIYLISPAK